MRHENEEQKWRHILAWEIAASVLFSSYLSEYTIDPESGTLDSVRAFALARLLQTWPGQPSIEWTAGDPRAGEASIRLAGDAWSAAKDFAAGYHLPARSGDCGARVTIAAEPSASPSDSIISLVWAAGDDTTLTTESGRRIPLTATLSAQGKLTWHRTTFAVAEPAPISLHFDKPVWLHRVVVRNSKIKRECLSPLCHAHR